MSMRIAMQFGDETVRAVLEDGEPARAFAARLPLTLRMRGSGIDYCARLPFALPYDPAHIHCGWADGDINYCPAGGWLAVLFGDEHNSTRYGGQLTLGRVEGSLDTLRALSGCYDVRIERIDRDDGVEGTVQHGEREES